MRTLPIKLEMARKDGETREFLIKKCAPEDLIAVSGLQEQVLESVHDGDIFMPTWDDELAESLELDHCFGVMYERRMVAFTLMVSGRVSYRNYGTLLGYDDEQLLKTVSMDTSFVLPECRGFGMQQLFFDIRMECARDLGAAEALTTIAPSNRHSLVNAIASGFEIADTLKIYGGLERHILKKSLL